MKKRINDSLLDVKSKSDSRYESVWNRTLVVTEIPENMSF